MPPIVDSGLPRDISPVDMHKRYRGTLSTLYDEMAAEFFVARLRKHILFCRRYMPKKRGPLLRFLRCTDAAIGRANAIFRPEARIRQESAATLFISAFTIYADALRRPPSVFISSTHASIFGVIFTVKYPASSACSFLLVLPSCAMDILFRQHSTDFRFLLYFVIIRPRRHFAY